jgi:hypothetical protein
MNKAILHIGMPKTGTSIIQSHLQQNRRVLRDKGVFYPVTISPDPGIYRTFESHHLLFYALAGQRPFNRFSPDRFMERAKRAAARYRMDTLLLSAENLWWLPTLTVREEHFDPLAYWEEKRRYLERVAAFLSPLKVQVVVYLRRQDHWIESWYNQQIKNGYAVPDAVERFAREQDVYIDLRRNLDLWSDYFGRENMVVRLYERTQLPNGLLNDLLSVCGLGDESEYPLRKAGRHNAKLDRDTMELLRLLNRTPIPDEGRRWLRMTLRKVSNQFERKEVFKSLGLMSPDARRRLLERYAQGNAQVAREYLGRDDGQLFIEPPPGIDDPWEPYPGLPNDFLAQMLVALFAERTFEGEEGCRGESADTEVATSNLEVEEALWERHLWGEVE